jgi:hypothetical protein
VNCEAKTLDSSSFGPSVKYAVNVQILVDLRPVDGGLAGVTQQHAATRVNDKVAAHEEEIGFVGRSTSDRLRCTDERPSSEDFFGVADDRLVAEYLFIKTYVVEI